MPAGPSIDTSHLGKWARCGVSRQRRTEIGSAIGRCEHRQRARECAHALTHGLKPKTVGRSARAAPPIVAHRHVDDFRRRDTVCGVLRDILRGDIYRNERSLGVAKGVRQTFLDNPVNRQLRCFVERINRSIDGKLEADGALVSSPHLDHRAQSSAQAKFRKTGGRQSFKDSAVRLLQ